MTNHTLNIRSHNRYVKGLLNRTVTTMPEPGFLLS
jgi:hypothetical protein